MEIASLSSLRIELLKYGYHECLWLAITCPHCGEFRGGVLEHTFKSRMLCPKCERASHADILAIGFTSRLNEWGHVPPKAILTWRQQEQAGHELYRLRDEIRRNRRSTQFA